MVWPLAAADCDRLRPQRSFLKENNQENAQKQANVIQKNAQVNAHKQANVILEEGLERDVPIMRRSGRDGATHHKM